MRISGPLRDKNFLIYSLGNTVSWVGTWAQRIGVGWLSWDLTHRTAWVGAISLAQLLPLIAFGPLFGTLLDRHDHRRYALGVNVVLALLAVALYALTALHAMQIGLLCAMAVLLGIANSAYQAVRLAMINDVVASEQLSEAIAINSVLFNLTRAVGPAIAGVIIAQLGIAAAFAFNAVSFLGILAALLVVQVRPQAARHAPQGLLAESRAGIRYVFQHRGMRQLMLLSAITSILGRGVIELLPAFADSVFRRGSVGLADLTTSAGIGAIAGALLLSRLQGARSLPSITRKATLALGGVIAAFALCTSFRVGLALAGLCGFTIVLSSVGLQVLLQAGIRADFRGRVLGLWSAVNMAGPGVGAALTGTLAQLAGLKAVSATAGLLCIVLIILAMPPSRPLHAEHARYD
ncbi:MAG: MFS transporter [Gammaproteobacteria bacterium]|nr:MFS transporter [Gammaproteobacteria bacterium]